MSLIDRNEINDNEEYYIGCSDDENYDFNILDGKWIPPAKDIVRLYESLDKGEPVNIEWICPGRRELTHEDSTTLDDSQTDDTEEDFNDTSDFDFQEEMSHMKLDVRPSSNHKPKGSAKKKTTSLDAILSNMARHRKFNIGRKEGRSKKSE